MNNDPSPIHIFGHKNPDADAICSVLGYEAYRHARGEKHYVAARCGNSNARIDMIMERFGLSLPVFIGDVTPRLEDIMTRQVWKIGRYNTCAEALELIDEHDVRALAVVENEDRLIGAVSIFQLGEHFTPRVKEPLRMRRVTTTIDAIVRSLKAQVLNLHQGDVLHEFFVRVGAMDIRSFGSVVGQSSIAPEDSIIIVGDRWDIQEKCLQLGVRLLVITGNLQVEPDMVERARQRNVSLITSPFDSATTSWIIRSASFIETAIDREVIKFSAQDRVRDVQRKISRRYNPLYFVTDTEDKLLGVFSKSDLFRPSGKRIALLDHNELTQAVNGAGEVEIAEIIDHHRLGNIPTDQPILFMNQPVGSTCTIVADLFHRDGMQPSPAIAGVLMAGIISDTLNLTGPTTTPRDGELLSWLSTIAGEDANKLADAIFSSGSILLSETPARVIETDCKVYEEGEVRFSVSQIEELGFDNFWAREGEIFEALESYRESEKLMFSSLLVTDINRQNSLLVVAGGAEVAQLISYPAVVKDRIFDLAGIVSRKKQVIPYLASLFHG